MAFTWALSLMNSHTPTQSRTHMLELTWHKLSPPGRSRTRWWCESSWKADGPLSQAACHPLPPPPTHHTAKTTHREREREQGYICSVQAHSGVDAPEKVGCFTALWVSKLSVSILQHLGQYISSVLKESYKENRTFTWKLHLLKNAWLVRFLQNKNAGKTVKIVKYC